MSGADNSTFYHHPRGESLPGSFRHRSKWLGIGLAVPFGIVVGWLLTQNIVMAVLVVGAFLTLLVATNPWRGVVLLLLATHFNGFRFDYGAFTFRPDQLVFVIVLLVAVIFFLRGRLKLYRTLLDVPIALFLLVGLIASVVNSPDPTYSYQGLLLQTVYASMYFLTVNIMLNYRDRLDDTVKAFIVFAILHAGYAIVAFVAFQAGITLGGISTAHYRTLSFPSTSGFFQEANLYAAFVATAVVLVAAHLVSNEETGIMKRRTLVIGLLMLLTVTATSMTRSVWVGLLIILLILPFYSRPRRNVINPKAVGIIISLVVGLGLLVLPALNYAFSAASGKPDALYQRMSELVDFSSGSGAGRLDIQDIALERWDERPFIGHGVLSLEGREGSFGRGWLYSSFIQSLFDTGIIGAAMIILIHLIPIIYAFMAARRTSDSSRKATLMGLSFGALVMLIASQASSFLWLGFPWVYLGMLMAISKATLDDSGHQPRSRIL